MFAPDGTGPLKRRALAVLEIAVKGFARLPLVDRLHPWMRPDKTSMRWLPINQDIEMPADSPMPLELLFRVIEEASHRVIIDYCGCRKGFGCEHYPVDIGCLMMGDSALEITRLPYREVEAEEAKAHALKAVDAGLVPVVGKARLDNFLFGVKDRSTLFTTCFCCECCCVTRYTALNPAKRLDPVFPRLKSISVTVTDDCTGCGRCVDHCYIEAIEISDGKAVINDYCRACGRCATVCPSGAVSLRIDDPGYLEEEYREIRSYVKYD